MSEAQISGLGHCAPTLRSRRIQSRAVEVTEQTVQHLSHFYGLAREGVESTCCDHPSVSRDDQVVLQFRGRVERELRSDTNSAPRIPTAVRCTFSASA